jgi:hypothetical protein
MKYLYISVKVENRIEALKKAGKAGVALAQKTILIIESLTSGAVRHHMDAIGSYTKYGENRIKNCRKYDLGCGYRLITLQRGGKVYIPFLGTHDECQRWLENNSRLKEVPVGKGKLLKISPKAQTPASRSYGASTDIVEDLQEDRLLEISDKVLRCVFSGLVEGTGKQ